MNFYPKCYFFAGVILLGLVETSKTRYQRIDPSLLTLLLTNLLQLKLNAKWVQKGKHVSFHMERKRPKLSSKGFKPYMQRQLAQNFTQDTFTLPLHLATFSSPMFHKQTWLGAVVWFGWDSFAFFDGGNAIFTSNHSAAQFTTPFFIIPQREVSILTVKL